MGRSRKSKRKLNSIYMMLLLTTILMVVSTYAWFSANREVSITGITAKVAAAEGLQISLDGTKWGSSVEVNETTLTAATQAINRFTWPDELEPVSTDGTYTGGDLNFYYGDISADGTTLAGIGKAVDSDQKYIVFDVYLKNSSSNASGDKLQLATGSSIAINTTEGGKDNTGLENSVRAAVLLYADSTVFTAPLGNNTTQLTENSIRTIAGIQPVSSTNENPKVAIWEPNHDQHIDEIIQNDSRISASPETIATLAMNSASFARNIKGVNGSTAAAGQSVDGSGEPVAADATAGPFMTAPSTLRTAATVSGTDVDMTDVSATPAIMKARVYIYLEGQDPDCIDTASTGRAFDIQINLAKPAKTQATPTPSPAGG